MGNPPFGANNLGTNPCFGTNVPIPIVRPIMQPIGTNATIRQVGTNIPPIARINQQFPMVSNLTECARNPLSPKEFAIFLPSLPSHSNIRAMKQNNENVTNDHIKNMNQNKSNDNQINENEIKEIEKYDNSYHEEENDEGEEKYESDNHLNEFNKTLDSTSSEDAPFDLEEYVYLKLKKSYIKVSNTAYNTLVHIGHGTRYCFVCAIQIEYRELQKHVDSRPHLENMDKNRFLAEYESHLLRQVRIYIT